MRVRIAANSEKVGKIGLSWDQKFRMFDSQCAVILGLFSGDKFLLTSSFLWGSLQTVKNGLQVINLFVGWYDVLLMIRCAHETLDHFLCSNFHFVCMHRKFAACSYRYALNCHVSTNRYSHTHQYNRADSHNRTNLFSDPFAPASPAPRRPQLQH